MARAPRIDLGGYCYHVINRASGRLRIFKTKEDFEDFEYLLDEMRQEYGIDLFAYTIMSNHWHLLLSPQKDGNLSRALGWLSTTHAARHHVRQGTIGNGHVYQGRYKSSLVEEDVHFLTVLKYIERNPVRAKMCKRAEDWEWGSAYRRAKQTKRHPALLAEPLVVLPRDYVQWVNTADSVQELDEIRRSINKSVAYGEVELPMPPMLES